MRRLLLSGFFLLSSVGLANTVQVSKSTIQVLDTQAVARMLINSANSWLNSLLSQLNLPGFLKEPVDNILRSLYEEVMCNLKTPPFTAKIEIPSGVSVPLSCSEINISFSPLFREIVSNANSLSGGVLDNMHRCLNGDKEACIEVAKSKGYSQEVIAQKKNQNDVMFLKGVGQESLASKTSQEIENEYEKRVNNLAKPAVDTTNPKGVVKNNVVEQVRFAQEKEASTSTGQLMVWGKEYTKNYPPQIAPLYNYIANKQLARETVIATLRERIKQERVNLARLAGLVRAWCNKSWNIKTIPPVRGGLGGLLGKQEKKLTDKLQELAKAEGQKQEFLKNSIFVARAEKNLPLVRCCCCDAIPAIHAAKSAVITKIEISTREIMNTIRAVGNMLANVISEEEYRTRQQINADAQAITDTLKQTMCLQAQLEYQRNALMLLELEVEVAKLETAYAQLNKEEMKEYEEKIQTLRVKY